VINLPPGRPNSIFFQALPVILPALLGVIFFQVKASGQTTEPSYLIKQNSVRYGSVTALVNSRHFRMDAMGMKIYMKPPFTALTFYGDSNRLRYSCSVDHVGSRITLRQISAREKKAGTREVITSLPVSKIAGFTCSHYLCEQISKAGKREKVAEFWTTRESKLPKALEIACSKLTSCPLGYGLPIKVFSFDNNRPIQQLETTKVENKTFTERAFAEPLNYKQARDEFELMMEDGSSTAIKL